MSFQGKKVRKKVPVLPEAEGNNGEILIGSNTNLRILTLGDSSMAGVGVNTQKEGFVGTFANELALKLNTDVTWKVLAGSGYTTENVKNKIVPKIKEIETDLIVIGVGGNDALKLNTLKKWVRDIKELVSEVRIKYKDEPIVFINMPPIREVPSFTTLIKFIIGNLMDIFSDELKELVKNMDGVYYYSRKITYDDYVKRLNIDFSHKDFFSDGFHASKLTYQVWAKDVCTFLIENGEIRNKLQRGMVK
jgi:lysophospholipase L1-like esterase